MVYNIFRVCVCVCMCVCARAHKKIYIYVRAYVYNICNVHWCVRGGGGGGGREVASGAAREGADSVNGILLGHPFTRTRRKLEDLIWRAVWIAFVPAMPPIEPSVIYARAHTHTHIHTCTRITRVSLYTRRGEHEARMQARVWRDAAAAAAATACAYVHVRTPLVRARSTRRSSLRERSSFVRPRARASSRATGGGRREDARVCRPAHTYVWVLTFHDLSRSFQRASKRS
jgi:hypothetical protein